MVEGEKPSPGSVCRCHILWRPYLLSWPTSITFTQQPRSSPCSSTFRVVRHGLPSPLLAGTVFRTLMLSPTSQNDSPAPHCGMLSTLGGTQAGYKGKQMEEASPVPRQAWKGEGALYTHMCWLGTSTCCALTATLNPWQWLTPTESSSGGTPAHDLNYVDTRLDSQIGGTNGLQSPSHALSFPPWLLLSMLQVSILFCDM